MAGDTVREMVAAKIKLDNPTFIVKSIPVRLPEKLSKDAVYVSVVRLGITNAPEKAAIKEELRITLITSKSGTEAAELELETALDAVLTSLSALTYVRWIDADRTIPADTYIGYDINFEAHTENDYKP